MASSIRKHRLGLVVIAAVCCLLLLLAYELPHRLLMMVSPQKQQAVLKFGALWAFDGAERDATNYLYRYGRKARLDPRIVFLGIDTESYEQGELFDDERQHPALQLMRSSLVGTAFPRAVYAHVVERLAEAGAKVVMLDINFPTVKAGDEVFKEVLQKYASQVVIGSNLQIVETERGGTSGECQGPATSLIPDENNRFDRRVGFVNFKPDADGLVRRIDYRTTEFEYFDKAGEEGAEELFSLTAQGARQAGLGWMIPTDHDSRQFRFPDPERVTALSLKDIFVPTIWEKNLQGGKFFKDKLVFVGPYGNWSKDELPTPLGIVLGPRLHISALNALLTHDFLWPSTRWVDVVLILMGGIVAVAAGFYIAHPVKRGAVLLLIAGLYVLAVFMAFNQSGLVLSLLGPNIALLLSGSFGLAWEQVKERTERTRVRKTLERYVSKDVVKEVLDNPDTFLNVQGGMRKPITILFSDVRGFTTMTESADATQLVTQLNEYFTQMVRIVFAHHGTLDKFIGDAVMAHWGIVVTRGPEADACRAVAAALDMMRVLPKLNAGWVERGFQPLNIGLGINHGDPICANIGSEEKQEVTAIGDAVNLASRLEGATKEFHQDLLIGEKVAPLVRESFHLKTVDLLQVKGKTKPVEVFTVLGAKEKDVPAPAWLGAYEEGVVCYRARAFVEGEALFAKAAEEIPEDWLANEYLRRCREYQQTPPPEGWNGVFVMTKK